ncbi:hypothetical protein DSP71_12395 [Microbacterium sp. H6]|nr:hypothetical protein DSP71_12395 [Microbacterium sp. H6]
MMRRRRPSSEFRTAAGAALSARSSGTSALSSARRTSLREYSTWTPPLPRQDSAARQNQSSGSRRVGVYAEELPIGGAIVGLLLLLLGGAFVARRRRHRIDAV